MAKNNKPQFSIFKNNKKIKSNLDLLDKSLDSLYQDTYYNQSSNSKDSESIRDDIEKSIDSIMGNTYSNTSIGNMTKMYTKLQLGKMEGNKELKDAIRMF
jgi:hypothetical protein